MPMGGLSALVSDPDNILLVALAWPSERTYAEQQPILSILIAIFAFNAD